MSVNSPVTEILQSSGKLAKENIVLKVETLKRKVEMIKAEVQDKLKEKYVYFLPRQYVKLDKLTDSINLASDEYAALYNQIENEVKPRMSDSVVELHNVLEDLKEIKKIKSIVLDLVAMHDHLDSAKGLSLNSMHLNAAEILVEFHELFQPTSKQTVSDNDIKIYSAIGIEYFTIRDKLLYNINKLWKQNVTFEQTFEGREKKLQVSLVINDKIEELDILNSLKLLKAIEPLLLDFGKRFLDLVCKTTLSNQVITENVKKEYTSILTVKVVSSETPKPLKVIENLKVVFHFLNTVFCTLPLNADGSSNFVKELGGTIESDFCTMLLEKCLKAAVPSQGKKMDEFHELIGASQNLCNDLQQMHFLSLENQLQDFISNYEKLPVNKMAQDIHCRARNLMQQSLYPTMYVGVNNSSEPASHKGNVGTDPIEKLKNSISELTLTFPYCQISESIQKLENIFLEVMMEAKNMGPQNSMKLYYAIRNICELYCCVTPVYHKMEITEIPQQTAIFHNNCMHLAYVLTLLNIQYKCVLQPDCPVTFIDLQQEIRKLGAEYFLAQMRKQRQQLLQLLQEEQVFHNIGMKDELISKAEKCVQQCLCQMQLLQKVWSDVLPTEVYMKSIGTLFNTCLEEIILHVVAMDDIAAETAAQLDSLFGILLKQGPLLLRVSTVDKSDSVHKYVRRWFKFQELQLILSASMQEIVDRWASAKGPLAIYFTADETKHLIRALFQNTDRRAAVLAKIK